MTFNILSERGYMNWPSWNVVYEWEDVIAQKNGCKIFTFREGIVGKFIRRGIREVNKHARKSLKYKMTDKSNARLLFVMNTAIYRDLPTKNIIPVFLDFPVSTVDQIINATSLLPAYFVTCKDIYHLLKEKSVENVYYMPLSISDKYYRESVPKKTIDVIQFGRKNDVLHQFMLQYCKKRPEVEYVYQTSDGSLTYFSTIRGNIGKFDSRDEYMDLIKSCKVSLVSSPGCDNGRSEEFGAIDFITPRFYESAAMYCHMLGRYTENEEAKDLQIRSICPNVRDYDEFNERMNQYLNDTKWDWSVQREFTKCNLTSFRADYINIKL